MNLCEKLTPVQPTSCGDQPAGCRIPRNHRVGQEPVLHNHDGEAIKVLCPYKELSVETTVSEHAFRKWSQIACRVRRCERIEVIEQKFSFHLGAIEPLGMVENCGTEAVERVRKEKRTIRSKDAFAG